MFSIVDHFFYCSISQINQAYEILSDTSKRQNYDLSGENSEFMTPGGDFRSGGNRFPQGSGNPFSSYGGNPFDGSSYSNFQFNGKGANMPPDMSNIFDDIFGSFFSGEAKGRKYSTSSSFGSSSTSYDQFFGGGNSPKPKPKSYSGKNFNNRQPKDDSSNKERMYSEITVECTLDELYTGIIKKLKVTDEIASSANAFASSNIMARNPTTIKISRVIELDIKPGN